MRKQFLKVLSIVFILSFPLAILLSWKSEFMVLILLGKNWLLAIEPMSILFFCIPFRIVYRFSDALLQSLGIPSIIAKANLISFIILLPVVFMSVNGGIVSVSWAFLCCAIMQIGPILYVVFQKLTIRTKQFFYSFSKAIFPSILMFVFCFLSEQLPHSDSFILSFLNFAFIPTSWWLLLIVLHRIFPKMISPELADIIAQINVKIRSVRAS